MESIKGYPFGETAWKVQLVKPSGYPMKAYFRFVVGSYK